MECVKRGLGVLCWRFLTVRYSRWSGRPVEVDSNQMETLIEKNLCSTMCEIADILKISKSIKLLVKMKNVSFILWRKHKLFGQLSTFIGLLQFVVLPEAYEENKDSHKYVVRKGRSVFRSLLK